MVAVTGALVYRDGAGERAPRAVAGRTGDLTLTGERVGAGAALEANSAATEASGRGTGEVMCDGPAPVSAEAEAALTGWEVAPGEGGGRTMIRRRSSTPSDRAVWAMAAVSMSSWPAGVPTAQGLFRSPSPAPSVSALRRHMALSLCRRAASVVCSCSHVGFASAVPGARGLRVGARRGGDLVGELAGTAGSGAQGDCGDCFSSTGLGLAGESSLKRIAGVLGRSGEALGRGAGDRRAEVGWAQSCALAGSGERCGVVPATMGECTSRQHSSSSGSIQILLPPSSFPLRGVAAPPPPFSPTPSSPSSSCSINCDFSHSMMRSTISVFFPAADMDFLDANLRSEFIGKLDSSSRENDKLMVGSSPPSIGAEASIRSLQRKAPIDQLRAAHCADPLHSRRLTPPPPRRRHR